MSTHEKWVTADMEWGLIDGNVMQMADAPNREAITVESLLNGTVDPNAWVMVIAVGFPEKETHSWHVFFRYEPAKMGQWMEEQEMWLIGADGSEHPYIEKCYCQHTKQEVIDFILSRMKQWEADDNAMELLEAAGLLEEN